LGLENFDVGLNYRRRIVIEIGSISKIIVEVHKHGD
jgi:hypothetical protein